MSHDPSRPERLDYAQRRARRRPTRGMIVAVTGAAVATIGVVVFLGAHEITGRDYESMVGEHARLHELLWAAFGIALLLAGALIAAAGLAAWCRGEAR